jgi:hypothetical protein
MRFLWPLYGRHLRESGGPEKPLDSRFRGNDGLKYRGAFSRSAEIARWFRRFFRFMFLPWSLATNRPKKIDLAHLPDVLEGFAQARRGEFASDAEIEAVFRRFGG